MRHLLLTLSLVGAIASTGCYTVNASLPGTLRGDVKSTETEQLGSLKVEKTNWFFLWGLIGDPPPDFFAGEIKRQVQAKGADGIANLTYESETGCVDLIIGFVTAGCVAPRTFKVTGDLVRINAAPLPGKSMKAADATPISPTQIAQSF